MKSKYFSVSISAILIFIATVLYYIISPWYIGMYPIGITTGLCISVQLAMIFIGCRNIAINGYKVKSVIALCVEVLSIIGMAYFFIVWLMVI